MVIRWLHNGYIVIVWSLQVIWRVGVPPCIRIAGGETFIIYHMSSKINHNEYDAIGELFRRKLEDHRMPVDGNGWDEIKRRLGKRKKPKALWLWSAGAMVTAAAIALLFIVNQPDTGNTDIIPVSQQVAQEETISPKHETTPAVPRQEDKGQKQADVANFLIKPTNDHVYSTLPGTDQTSKTDVVALLEPENMEHQAFDPGTIDQDGTPIVMPGNNQEKQPEEDKPIVAQTESDVPKLDVSLVEDRPDEEPVEKESKEWLLAAAFGTGGYTEGPGGYDNYPDQMQSSSPEKSLSGNNSYAANLSNNIRSFDNMTKNDFSNIDHRPPLSFGITARKKLGKFGGVESGLVYTYLSSRLEWGNYDVHQRLHYLGIPVNMVVYLWSSKPNWRIYLSGGVMVEKGLRAIYTQQERGQNGLIHTTIVKSSIDGWQWSVNSALGINYRFDKGFGIYFEPRVGYSFDNDQPISIRTEWPIYIGINLGLNYEF